MHPIVNYFEYIGLNHSVSHFYILQNFKNVSNMFLGIELNKSHINMDIRENKKNGLQFKNVKFIKYLSDSIMGFIFFDSRNLSNEFFKKMKKSYEE